MRYLIAHAPHAPGRKASLGRLLEQIPDAEVIPSRGPEHASIWARRVWERAADLDVSCSHAAHHNVILNDDVVLQPDFEGWLERAIAAQPEECISLHANNPNVATITGAWARCYHYSGPGVILPPGAAASLLEFVYSLPWSLLSRTNEDNIANAWAWARQRPFWYLLPSPLTHDVAVPSTLGYDHHPDRQAAMGPERDPAIADRDAVPFVELPWGDTRALRYRREVLRAGRQLCAFCLGREGVVGTASLTLCLTCLADLTNAALKGPR